MENKLIYDELLEQYNKLDEVEKKAILLYKSRLFKSINDPNNIENNYYEMKEIINNGYNTFIKYSVFSDVDFTSIDTFTKSIDMIKKVLVSASNKISLDRDITLYRGVSVLKETLVSNLSKSDIISTSIKLDDTEKFLFLNDQNDNYLFKINLEKGANLLISPYSVLIDERKEYPVLRVDKTPVGFQEEIILFQDNLDLEKISEREKVIDKENLRIIEINASKKEKYKKI